MGILECLAWLKGFWIQVFLGCENEFKALGNACSGFYSSRELSGFDVSDMDKRMEMKRFISRVVVVDVSCGMTRMMSHV